jgi:hypothetical protein
LARFAASPDIVQLIRSNADPAMDQRIEQFRDYEANYRSKGLAPELAGRLAQEALESNLPPSQSLRYQLLEDIDPSLDEVV